jgi:hypothetical protein
VIDSIDELYNLDGDNEEENPLDLSDSGSE